MSEPSARTPIRGRRLLFFTIGIILLVAVGYISVLFIAGNALQGAPFAQQILGVRERLGGLISVEPPRALPPILQPEEIPISPSPVIASPRPSPILSPTFVPPSPNSPTTLTFTIFYENTTGVRLTGVKITDNIPSGTTYVAGSSDPTASFDGGTLVWNLGTLDPGVKGSVQFKTTTFREGVVTNKAVMTSNEAPPSEVESSGSIS
jgi:uncharacterized repeat protein (TIGR01451 family)